jgi:GNAT superfamily N-acetyltransferase
MVKGNWQVNQLSNFGKSESSLAIKRLTSAFSEDPCLKYLLGSEVYDPEKAKYFHEYTIRIGLLYGLITTTSKNIEGISIWLPPKKVDISAWMFIRAGGLSLKKNVHPRIIDILKKYSNYSSEIHHRHANMPHWYLLSIAVDKQYQNCGYAKQLLNPVLQYFDSNHQTCYLETHNANNIKFYEKFNFEVVETGILPDSNKTHWGMLRKPKK